MHSPGFVANTDEEAREVFWPHYRVIRDRIGALRGWPPIRREEYEREIASGSLYIGSPETVARKIARAVTALGVGRFDLIYTAGAQPVSARLRAVELYGTKVIAIAGDDPTISQPSRALSTRLASTPSSLDRLPRGCGSKRAPSLLAPTSALMNWARCSTASGNQNAGGLCCTRGPVLPH
jgi:hypothetical protein